MRERYKMILHWETEKEISAKDLASEIIIEQLDKICETFDKVYYNHDKTDLIEMFSDEDHRKLCRELLKKVSLIKDLLQAEALKSNPSKKEFKIKIPGKTYECSCGCMLTDKNAIFKGYQGAGKDKKHIWVFIGCPKCHADLCFKQAKGN